MPGMNGHEVCRRLRENEATAALPVIMITATGDSEKVAALDAGADDFIPRPFDQAELLARVRSLLRIKAYHDTIVGQAAELSAWNRVLEEQVREQVEEVQRLQRLRRFLSSHVAEAVLATGDDTLLQPHRREIAVVFCDLRGFTAFAGASEPEEVLSALQGYHRLVGDVVTRHAATVGYFAGDGVMMFFNDPFPCPDPALRAVTAAVELRDAMEAFAVQWRERGSELSVGVGLSLGFATLGLIGFEGRHDYSAIGPVVNLASRLCDEAGPGEILIGQRTCGALQGRITATPRGELVFRGVARPVPIWRLDEVRQKLPPLVPAGLIPSPTPMLAASEAVAPPAIAGDQGVHFRLLGSIDIEAGDQHVALRASKERHLLTLLLINRGRVMSVDRLADELWEGSPPETATAALRVHVSRLRKALAAAGAEGLLVTRPTGYQLDIADDALDVCRFEQLASRGRDALAAGDAEQATRNFREALALWRGPALADVAASPLVVAESARLEESKVATTEDCIEAELACGRHRNILGELESLVRVHPLRERLWAQRMIALYRSGRQPEALAVYQTLRHQLAEELGLEPSPDLADLHQQILTRSADLEYAH
jgi:DNA-binding SARP family transcriptional activator